MALSFSLSADRIRAHLRAIDPAAQITSRDLLPIGFEAQGTDWPQYMRVPSPILLSSRRALKVIRQALQPLRS